MDYFQLFFLWLEGTKCKLKKLESDRPFVVRDGANDYLL
jgi:hypothetical protein